MYIATAYGVDCIWDEVLYIVYRQRLGYDVHELKTVEGKVG